MNKNDVLRNCENSNGLIQSAGLNAWVKEAFVSPLMVNDIYRSWQIK